MKKLIALCLCLFVVSTNFNIAVLASEDKSSFWSEVAEMVSKYDEDD